MSARPLWWRVLVLVCLFLIAGASVAQAAHIHGEWLPSAAAHAGKDPGQNNLATPENCSLCVAMHAAMPVSTAVSTVAVQADTLLLRAIVAAPPLQLWQYELFSRPPPALL